MQQLTTFPFIRQLLRSYYRQITEWENSVAKCGELKCTDMTFGNNQGMSMNWEIRMNSAGRSLILHQMNHMFFVWDIYTLNILKDRFNTVRWNVLESQLDWATLIGYEMFGCEVSQFYKSRALANYTAGWLLQSQGSLALLFQLALLSSSPSSLHLTLRRWEEGSGTLGCKRLHKTKAENIRKMTTSRYAGSCRRSSLHQWANTYGQSTQHQKHMWCGLYLQ